MPDPIIFNGEPGTSWVNDTGKVQFQFVASLQNTCGACLQYHLAIGSRWPIPIHRRCRCKQLVIAPGRTAPHPFVDFRQLLDDMPHDQQVKAIGDANYKLLNAGVVDWKEVVNKYSVRPLRQVVAINKISLETMLKVGIKSNVANAAYKDIHTPEATLIRQHRAQLVKAIKDAGVGHQSLVDAISKAKVSQVTIVGPTKTQSMAPLVARRPGGPGPGGAAPPPAPKLPPGPAPKSPLAPPAPSKPKPSPAPAPTPKPRPIASPAPTNATGSPTSPKATTAAPATPKPLEVEIEKRGTVVLVKVNGLAMPVKKGQSAFGKSYDELAALTPGKHELTPVSTAGGSSATAAAKPIAAPTPDLPKRNPIGPTPPEHGSLGRIGESLPGPMFKTQPPEQLPARNPTAPTPSEPGSTGRIGESLPGPKFKLKPEKKKGEPKPKPESTSAFPKSGDEMTVIKPLGGSTGAKLVKDSSGKLYVAKKGANAGHLKEEATADALYRKLGIDVPTSKVYDNPAGPTKLSEFHEGKSLGDLKYSDPAAYEKARAELKKGFVADALLGNWDVIGASADNVLVTASGKVLRIDNGGSLRYRAQGGLKPSTQWSGQVGELESLRSHTINPHAAAIFHDITPKEIKEQIKAIVRKEASLTAAAPAEIRDVLKQRIAYLKDYAKTADTPAKPIKVGNWKATPADAFKNISPDLRSWGERHYKEWRESLSPDERDAIKNYTGSGYHGLNKYLRGQTTTPPANASIVPSLDKALNAKPVPEDVVVYRGLNMSGIYAKMGISGRNDLRPGMDLSDKGYTSTSPDAGKAWSGEKWEIRVKKGTPGAWVAPVSIHEHEKEFLLGRDVDTFRIVDVKPDKIVVEALRSEDLAKKRRGAKP